MTSSGYATERDHVSIDPVFTNTPDLGPDFEDVVEVVWLVAISKPRCRIRVDLVADGGYLLTVESYDTDELVRFERIPGVAPDNLPAYRSKAIELAKTIMIEAWAEGDL